MKIEKVNLSFRDKLTPIKKVDKLVLHHPAHKTWDIQEIHNYHKNALKWSGIGYNYFITFDGRIQEGRGKNVGAHCSGHNSHTLGLSFQGNFDEQKMTDAQVEAGGWLIAQFVREYGLTLNDVIGHRDLAKTDCPGKNFRMADVKNAALGIINPNVKKEVSAASNDKRYRLVTGTFGTKSDAETAAAKVKKEFGYVVYIKEE